MTEMQRKVLQMYIDGNSYSEIGRQLGMSRQAVHQHARAAVSVRVRKVYPHYRKLQMAIMDNGFRSIKDFASRCGVNYTTILHMFKHGSKPRWDTINQLMDATGLTAEEIMDDTEDDYVSA